MTFRLWLPARIEVEHRDLRDMGPVRDRMGTFEDFTDLEKAKAKACEILKHENGWWSPHELRIERLTDYEVVATYDDLKQACEKPKR